jgi:hypothetical protein
VLLQNPDPCARDLAPLVHNGLRLPAVMLQVWQMAENIYADDGAA